MRVVESTDYVEPRDALAQDWGRFMAVVLPGARWIPLPNLGQSIEVFATDWDINALILTGGNDIGSGGAREATEYTLLTLAIQHNWPVLGVCRGMQFLQTYFQGSLSACDIEQHISKRHALRYRLPSSTGEFAPTTEHTEVNSFHSQGIQAGKLADGFQAFATSEDNLVEGMLSTSRQLFGIMWHPEREQSVTSLDQYLLQTLFREQGFR